MKRPSGSKLDGVVPAVASAWIPGLGQLLNGEGDKAIGVFVTAGICGLSILGSIPVIASAAWLVGGGTWIYGVVDGYVTGKRKG